MIAGEKCDKHQQKKFQQNLFRKWKTEKRKKTSKWKINVKIKLDVMLGIYPLSFVTEYAWCTTHWQRRKQQRGRYTLEHVVVNSKTKKKKSKELNRE